jgi:hypothetical protein
MLHLAFTVTRTEVTWAILLVGLALGTAAAIRVTRPPRRRYPDAVWDDPSFDEPVR